MDFITYIFTEVICAKVKISLTICKIEVLHGSPKTYIPFNFQGLYYFQKLCLPVCSLIYIFISVTKMADARLA